MIRIEHLKKEFADNTPLQDVTVEIHEGDVISVIGPSGVGKSTLLRCINLLERPTGGRILVDGEEITARGYDVTKVHRKVGMVFQSFNLFGHMTVVENIMRPPMDLLGRDRKAAYRRAMELLQRVGLADKAMNYPDQLSGGQKQGVAIARTLAMDPAVILLDEPTSALDPTMVGEVQAVIRDLAQSGKTMMIVTHEMQFARAICNRVFYMDQGGVYEDGTPEQIFEHPQKERTRQFIRRLKVLRLDIDSKTYDFPGAGTQIEQYCAKNTLPSRIRNRLALVFEELIQQILFPRLSEPRIQLTVEYAEADNLARVTVRYNGPAFDPAESEDPLSYRVLTSAVSELTHEAETDGAYTNLLRLCISENKEDTLSRAKG